MYNNQRSKQIIERDYTIGNHQSGPNRFNAPKRGLVGEWLLNGDAVDSLGLNNGTATNVSWVDAGVGYTKQAGSFNGTNAYITIPSISGFTDTTLFTISIDFYLNSTANQCIFTKQQNVTNEFGFSIIINAGKYLSSSFKQNVGANDIISTASATTGQHNITYTFDGTTYKQYIDGVLDGSATKTISGTTTSNAIFNIGRNYVNTQFLNGTVKIVRLFNTILTNKEIKILYKEGLKLLH